MRFEQSIHCNGFITTLSFDVSLPALRDLHSMNNSDDIESRVHDLLPVVSAEVSKRLAVLAQQLELVVVRESSSYLDQELPINTNTKSVD